MLGILAGLKGYLNVLVTGYRGFIKKSEVYLKSQAPAQKLVKH